MSFQTPEWHREHAIFGTDFTKHPSDIIEDIRCQLSRLRGQLSDIGYGYPGWKERLDDAEGMLTGVIFYLYDVRREMERVLKAGGTTPPAPGGTPSKAQHNPRSKP